MSTQSTEPDPAPRPRYRLPERPPTQQDVVDRDAWAALSTNSLPAVQASAEKWRNGLAALVALVTGGLIIKGPSTASDIATPWRATITILCATALLLAIAGLWLALKAEAGTPARISLPAIKATYGSIDQFKIAAADRAARWLQSARQLVAIAVLVLLITVGVWAWAPQAPTAYLTVDTASSSLCGELVSADGSVFRVQVTGEATPREIRFLDANNIFLVDKC